MKGNLKGNLRSLAGRGRSDVRRVAMKDADLRDLFFNSHPRIC